MFAKALNLIKLTPRTSPPLMSHEDAIACSAIEPGIVPLVKALNVPGLCQTISSCEGHGRPGGFLLPGSMKDRPFVFFRADTSFARGIARSIYAELGADTLLNYVWRIKGQFYPESAELVWMLELEDYRIPEQWNRARINDDLIELAFLVSRLIERS